MAQPTAGVSLIYRAELLLNALPLRYGKGGVRIDCSA